MIGVGSNNGIGRSQQRLHQVQRYPAPISGMDVRQSIGAEDMSTCVYTYNLSPFEYGMRVRTGYREWQTDVTSGTSNGINTLLPFTSTTGGNVGNKLFAVTNEGIWDVTSFGSTPVLKISFSDNTDDAGYGTFSHYITDAGADILFYADSRNGLFEYDPLANTWAIPTLITGVDVGTINGVTSHKERIWFSQRGSATGYYLGVGSIAGAVTPFYFGSNFQHGGALVGLFNWSVDGGIGVDDYLVAISSAGDVLPYQGSDPTQADWNLRGSYYIGAVPNSPTFGTEQGGELYLLSAYGIVGMNDLLKGVDAQSIQAETSSTIAGRIAGLIRGDMRDKISQRGWAVNLVPSEGGILVSVPSPSNQQNIQYYYNLSSGGWGLWRGVPMHSFTTWGDSVVFATLDNRVCIMDVAVDNLQLDPVDPLDNGVPVEFSILSAFSSLGTDGVYKQIKLIRPDFISKGEPTYSSQARYDYGLAEAISFQSSLPVPDTSIPIWNTAKWDAAVWGSSSEEAYSSVDGAWGTGRYAAIAMIGSAREETRLVGWDVVFTTGGVMR